MIGIGGVGDQRGQVPTMALYPSFPYQFAVNQVQRAQQLNSLGQLPLLRGKILTSNCLALYQGQHCLFIKTLLTLTK